MEEYETEALENDPILKRLRQSRLKKVAKCLQSISSCLLNPDLLVSQAFCIFLYGSFGAITPYLPLYFKGYSLAPYQVGIILGLGPIVQCLVSPIWRIIAGKWHAQKLVFICGVLSLLVKLLLFLAVRPHKQHCLQGYVNSTSNLTYYSSSSLNDVRKGAMPQWKVNTLVTVKPQKSPSTTVPSINSDALKGGLQDIEQFIRNFEDSSTFPSYSSRHLLAASPVEIVGGLPSVTTTYLNIMSKWNPSINQTVIYIVTSDEVEVYDIFLIFVLFVLICDFLQAPTFGLGDGSVFDRLEEQFRSGPNKMHFTRTIGWVVTVLVVGAIISGTRSLLCGSYEVSYYTAFYFSIGFVCMAFIHALWFEYIYKQNTETAPDIWKNSFRNLRKLKSFTLIFSSFYISLCAGFLEPFLNWYIDDINGNALVVATVCAIRITITFIFYRIGKTVVTSLGKKNVSLFSLMGYSVCFFCYWLVENAWVVLPIVSVEGIAFAFIWLSSDEFVSHDRETDLNVESLTRGIYQAVFWGIGPGLGAIAGGALYGWLGRDTFCALGVATIVVLALLGVICYFQAKNEEQDSKNYEEEDYPDEEETLNDVDELVDDESEAEAVSSDEKDESDKEDGIW